MQVLKIADEAKNKRAEMYMVEAQAANNATESWAKGFAAASRRNMQELTNFAKQGSTSFDIFGKHATNAFIEMGEGGQSASEILRKHMFGLISDICIQYGSMMLLAGIFPPNPPAIAGGAALLVLGGYLKSQASGTSALGAGSSIGGMTGIGEGGVGSVQTTDLAQRQQNQEKSTQLVIQGSIFDSESTRRRITELVREAQDSTDFSIQKVGGGV